MNIEIICEPLVSGALAYASFSISAMKKMKIEIKVINISSTNVRIECTKLLCQIKWIFLRNVEITILEIPQKKCLDRFRVWVRANFLFLAETIAINIRYFFFLGNQITIAYNSLRVNRSTYTIRHLMCLFTSFIFDAIRRWSSDEELKKIANTNNTVRV